MAKIKGTIGADTLTGTGTSDLINGNAGNDVINAGAGKDFVDGGAGNDTLNGEAGNDRVIGGAGNDTMNGGTENDFLDGSSGDDAVNGGDGIDTVNGGVGNDTINGDAGNDLVQGGAGNDSASGGTGDDTVTGGAGNDTLFGNDGNDILIGGIGGDAMTGGADTKTADITGVFWLGGDTLSYSDSTSAVTVVMDSGVGVVATGSAGDTWASVEHVTGSKFNDTITGSATVGGILAGGAGEDIINAGAAADELMRGDAGFDTLNGTLNNRDYFQAQYNLGTDTFVGFDNTNGTAAFKDIVVLSRAAFGLTVSDTPGTALQATSFLAATNNVALTATQHLIFETDTKMLWADFDGSGSAYRPVMIAQVEGVTLSASDFLVIA